jgi:nitric oxide reductase NorD protein
MVVLAEALDAVGDDFALYGFSSDSRLRVLCIRIKGFDDGYDERSRRALSQLTPANYTRMGAAIRHVGNRLRERPGRQKMLLVLTDGRPHDPTDRYEARYAVEDTRRALLELRVQGLYCFGLTIDQRGQEFLPYLFGPGHYAVLSDPHSLPHVLPRLYARITARGS